MNRTQSDVAQSIDHHQVSFGNEFIRKGIHLCSLSMPILYYFIPQSTALQIIIPVTLAALTLDVLKFFHKPTFDLYHKLFGQILRKHEKVESKKTLNGASWVLISATFCVLVFPKIIAITAFAILIISDTFAALVGRRFGTKKYRDKTVEGSTAFILSAFVVILFTPKVAHLPGEYLFAFIAAIIGAISEIFSFDIIDDNFAIPVSIGFTLWFLYWLFLPELNVYALEAMR